MIQLRIQAFLQIEKKRKGKVIFTPSAYAKSLLFVLRWAERTSPDDSGYRHFCDDRFSNYWPDGSGNLTGPPADAIRLMKIDGTWQVTRRTDSGDWPVWPHEDDTFEFS